MADDPLSAFGSGLGGIIGGGDASSAIGSGINNVTSLLQVGSAGLMPFLASGAGEDTRQTNALLTDPTWSPYVGSRRVDAPANPTDFSSFMTANGGTPTAPSFEDFSKNFNMSEGAKYLLNTASTAQDNSAASRGGFYSGANQRTQTQIAEGIANTDLLSQYQAMLSGHASDLSSYNANLAGQGQDFSQRETSFQNMFNEQSLGEKAAASLGLMSTAGAGTIGQLSAANAQAQQSKGGGFGSLISSALGFLAA